MGGGQGMSKIGQEADRALADISMQLYNQTKSLRQETLQQIEEGLTTGDIGARLPEIQQGVESSMVQGAKEQTQLTDAAAASGQSRTPFALRQAAETELASSARTALVPSDYISAIIRTGEPIIYGQAPGIAIEGLGGLANIASAERISSMQNQGNLIGGILGASADTIAAGTNYYLQTKDSNPAAGIKRPTSSGDSLYI